MLFKIIWCEVEKQHQKAFYSAQSKWGELSKAPGFVMQRGGWNLLNPRQAVILAIWGTKAAYDEFMRSTHDQMISNNRQIDTYTSISVCLYSANVNNMFVSQAEASHQFYVYKCTESGTLLDATIPGGLLLQPYDPDASMSFVGWKPLNGVPDGMQWEAGFTTITDWNVSRVEP